MKRCSRDGAQAAKLPTGEIGVNGIDDHEWDDQRDYRNAIQMRNAERLRQAVLAAALRCSAASDDESDAGNEDLVTAVEFEIEVENKATATLDRTYRMASSLLSASISSSVLRSAP